MISWHALHGFLGKPSDWNHLGLPLIAHDLLTISSARHGMMQWAEKFNAIASQSPAPRILMGYSLGGRLAMHALLSRPELWSGAIIISAHPGLFDDSAKKQRIEQDGCWAKRFESEAWDTLMHSWEGADIFKNGTRRFERKEQDYVRSDLAAIMRNWSLGVQENLAQEIAKLDMPILWIAGKNDLRYASSAACMKLKHEMSKVWIASNAAHRVPWDCPDDFKRQIEDFMLWMK